MCTNSVAVIVGRFQITELHEGHRYLINYAAARHQHLLICVGVVSGETSQRNPLDFQTRATMLRSAYPNATILPLPDTKSDKLWSRKLDNLIKEHFPSQRAVLYGSRDCFFSFYYGRNECVTVESHGLFCGTAVRSSVEVEDSKSFRAGVVYATKKRFPISFQTVDVAVIDSHRNQVLMGRKATDDGAFRFIGGFVDPGDPSLERAAKREVYEETSGIETDNYRYLGSSRIDDWRYRGSENQIMTAFFAAEYIFGGPTASDDLDELVWIPFERLPSLRVCEEHEPLKALLENYLNAAK